MTFRKICYILWATLGAGHILSAQAIPATGDAYTSTATPASNFGMAGTLNIGGGATSFVRFNLAGLPAGITNANVTKASLYLWVNKVNTAGTLDVSAAASDWQEASLNQGIAPPAGLVAAVSVPASSAATWVAIDVTNAVRNWVDTPANNFGFLLAASASAPATSIALDSRENTATGNGPVLNIVLNLTNGPTGQQGLPGAPGSPGVAGTQGSRGSVGSAGATGPAGAPGTAGPQGDPGGSGVQGLPGAAGLIGSPGTPGTPGGPGSAGGVGSTGPVGSAGLPGSQGTPGAAGLPGTQGPVGPTGPAGTQSVFGTNTGTAGPVGNEGIDFNVGQVLLFAGRSGAGRIAAGQSLQIANFALLNNILSGFFGQTSTTFALPDLRPTAPNNTSYFIVTSGIFPN